MRLRLFLGFAFSCYMFAFQTSLMSSFPTYVRGPFLAFFYSWTFNFVCGFFFFFFWFFLILYTVFVLIFRDKSFINVLKIKRYVCLQITPNYVICLLVFWVIFWCFVTLGLYFIWMWYGAFDNISDFSFEALVIAHHFWDNSFSASCIFALYWNLFDFLTNFDIYLFRPIFFELFCNSWFFLIIYSIFIDYFVFLQESHLYLVNLDFFNISSEMCLRLRLWGLFTPYFEAQTVINRNLVKFVIKRAFTFF